MVKITEKYGLNKKGLESKMRRAALGLTMGGIVLGGFSSCGGDEPDDPTKPIIPSTHVTTYTFGPDIALTDAQVKASADSSEVSEVRLKSDGKTWNGANLSIIKSALNKKAALSSKVKFEGNLKDVIVDNVNDSIATVAMNLTVNQK